MRQLDFLPEETNVCLLLCSSVYRVLEEMRMTERGG